VLSPDIRSSAANRGPHAIARVVVARLILPFEELQVMAREILSGRPLDPPGPQLDDVSLH
jgi:hypothetical protein